MIVHQKSGIRAGNQNENLAQIGEEKFDEIIGVDYFDAVEFRSGKVEGILNDYKNEKNYWHTHGYRGDSFSTQTSYPESVGNLIGDLEKLSQNNGCGQCDNCLDVVRRVKVVHSLAILTH